MKNRQNYYGLILNFVHRFIFLIKSEHCPWWKCTQKDFLYVENRLIHISKKSTWFKILFHSNRRFYRCLSNESQQVWLFRLKISHGFVPQSTFPLSTAATAVLERSFQKCYSNILCKYSSKCSWKCWSAQVYCDALIGQNLVETFQVDYNKQRIHLYCLFEAINVKSNLLSVNWFVPKFSSQCWREICTEFRH